MPRYLLPSLAYNRSAIMRQAWTAARSLVKALATAPQPFRKITTVRAVFGQCLVRAWDAAKSERSYAVWLAEQNANAAAEATRRAALSDHDRDLEDAELAVELAEYNDTIFAAQIARDARARLAALQAVA